MMRTNRIEIVLAFLGITLLILPGISAQTEAAHTLPPGSEAEVARLVFEYTNLERTSRGLTPFLPLEKLDRLALYHAENMRNQNFFSHTDKEGLDPEGRRRKLFPELLGGMGENIAYHYGATAEEAARNLVEGWMNSPPHRQNILAGGFSHMGVGIAADDQVYGVQAFGDMVAELVERPAEPVPFGSSGVTFRFRYLGNRAPERLTCFVKFADPERKFFVSSSRYYKGSAPLEPVWEGEEFFSLSIEADKGRGQYSLLLGFDGSFYPGGVDFPVQ